MSLTDHIKESVIAAKTAKQLTAVKKQPHKLVPNKTEVDSGLFRNNRWKPSCSPFRLGTTPDRSLMTDDTKEGTYTKALARTARMAAMRPMDKASFHLWNASKHKNR
jgi:hypothetical protein